ncbi:glycerol dehydrogenase [Halapricum desulfuricans]|uniref:Glycerol dehydrogenase or related enzyme n=1 Tax=Halapricum desulfuricans TaxID=2841257 RepID=A0A897NB79_9EURY|nr:glycerol dehydrogenase [Halapricum desulfuricans]QSG09678.1 Glycerol dehydrogenase or related enzyme [Halapricum desulfuricans]
MSQVFKSPAAYVQGRGVAEEIGTHAASLGEHALLLADEIVLGLVEDEVLDSLEDAGLEASSVEFQGEASEAEVDRISEIVRDRGADIVIGAGGGKALDTAKAVRENLEDGAMVSMPTVASTDAPTSALSVIYSEHGEFEEYWFYNEHPDLVLVDTDVVSDAPTRFFRSGIADGLATWFEADATYRSDGDNVVGGKPTRAGHRLARLCYETLREHGRSAVDAVERDAVTESVEAVTEANTLLSGLGFESGGLAAAHSVHNGLTQLEATHDATHGEKVNIGTITQLVLEGRDDEFIEDYVEFSREIGLPTALSDIGLDDPTDEQLDIVAEAACDPEETIHNQPFEVTPPMVRDALKTVDEIAGRVR